MWLNLPFWCSLTKGIFWKCLLTRGKIFQELKRTLLGFKKGFVSILCPLSKSILFPFSFTTIVITQFSEVDKAWKLNNRVPRNVGASNFCVFFLRRIQWSVPAKFFSPWKLCIQTLYVQSSGSLLMTFIKTFSLYKTTTLGSCYSVKRL